MTNPERVVAERPHLKLADPIEHAELLNVASEELTLADIESAETKFVIEEMLRIAAGKHEEGGAQMVGLAAPQVGVSKRIAIIDMAATGKREAQDMAVFINPRIVERSDDSVDGREGCWSCENYCANVPRASWVVVECLDRDGRKVRAKLEGFTARIAQHEIDHLDGMRCIDRVPQDEPWRLHRVNLADAAEFDRYRSDWPNWKVTFPREEWERFRNGLHD